MTETLTDAAAGSVPTLETIREDFAFIDDWEDRYRYVIELGRTLPDFAESDKTPENKVNGCVSQVWLTSATEGATENPVIRFRGDSDALIVRGLIAIAFGIFSGKPARSILETDALAIFSELGLEEHLTPQRSNGLKSMVERIRKDAGRALTT